MTRCPLCGKIKAVRAATCVQCQDGLSWAAVTRIWNRRHPTMPMNELAVKECGLNALRKVRERLMNDPALGWDLFHGRYDTQEE